MAKRNGAMIGSRAAETGAEDTLGNHVPEDEGKSLLSEPAPLPAPEATPGKRPAAVVMAPERLSASFPNALSFTRTLMRQVLQRRWIVERERIEINAVGEGEALYLVDAGGWEFRLFVISRELRPGEQNDRNFAAKWDATAALCQGPWTPEREAYLRREIPKQANGWVDYETLAVTRGNRSGRVFEHVVDRLAQGRQPDSRQLSEVGYILRTTSFFANGLLGTKPFHGYEADHPLRRPYHAQMFSAFLLREFVFDLVEVMAAARSPVSARLSPGYKRYLGVGNSAATGLTRYAYNHPRQMDRWCSTWEAAFAAAKARPVSPQDSEFRELGRLLEKAVDYFRQDGRPPSGEFEDAARLADDLEAIRARVETIASEADTGRHGDAGFLERLCRWSAAHASHEAVEILHAVILELFPDIGAHYAEFFTADEKLGLIPEMTARELRHVLASHYDWALSMEATSPAAERFFWFHSVLAPPDARRGYRHALPRIEHENHLETVRQIHKLSRYLETLPNATPVGRVAEDRPALRQIIRRVQSLSDHPYAEAHENPLSTAFSPFGLVRHVLAFFGVEKFDAAPSKVVRGALLQGAPIAEDVAAGRDGTWPFPLFPEDEDLGNETVASRPVVASDARVATLIRMAEDGDGRATVDDDEEIVISVIELRKHTCMALQAAGASLGLAEDLADSISTSAACGTDAIEGLLTVLGDRRRHAVRDDAVPPAGDDRSIRSQLEMQGTPAADDPCGPAVAERAEAANRMGLRLRRGAWRKLTKFAEGLLVSVEDEARLRENGFDATKEF